MELSKMLLAIENLIFEFAAWGLLVPKTLLTVLLDRRWPHRYIEEEFAKPAEDRFDAYLSPVLLWVLTVIIPYDFIAEWLLSTGSAVARRNDWKPFADLAFGSRLLVVAAFGLAGPLTFSALVLWRRGSEISRNELKKPFYTQCLCFTPFHLFLMPALTDLFMYDPGSLANPHRLNAISIFLALAWLLWVESSTLGEELSISGVRAAWTAVKYIVAAFFVTFGFELLVITVIGGLQVW
jgi:hypothetical protein